MKKKFFKMLFFIFTMLFYVNSFSQTYTDDSLAVRAILDTNGLYDINLEDVTDSSGGRITGLFINFNYFNILPSEIGNLDNLLILSIGASEITTLPKEIGNLINLEILYLGGNDLITIPKEIGNLTSLKVFELPNNDLKSLPTEIGKLINLQELNLFSSGLIEIPAEIGNLVNLQVLYLAFNNITELPPEIGKLINLNKLEIYRDTLLYSLPYEIGNLINLDTMYLVGNNFKTLPNSIVNLSPDLLNIAFNKINPDSLSDEVKAWADKYDPDWEDSQGRPILEIGFTTNEKHRGFYLKADIKKSSVFYNLPVSGNFKLQIYNLHGKSETLIDSYKPAGKYITKFNKQKYSSGIYYIKLSAGNINIINKAIIIE